MTDPAPVPAPAAEAEALPAPKRQGLVRWWGLILVLALVILALVVAPLVANSFVRSRLDRALAGQGWELTPESQLSVNVFGGRLAGSDLRLRELGGGAEVLRLSRLDADVAVLDSLGQGDLILDVLAAEGVKGTLRRGPTGRIPGQAGGDGKGGTSGQPGQPGQPGQASKPTDWSQYWREAMERAKRWRAEQDGKPDPGEPGKPGEEKKPQAGEPDPNWPKARRFQPLPSPGRPAPRVLVRQLSISGEGLELPDRTAFDVTSFKLTGATVASRLAAGETMKLDGTLVTAGAGDLTLALVRTGEGSGSLDLAAPAMPVQALNDPALGGEAVARYGASGSAAVTAAFAWTGWDLGKGDITATVKGLTLAPRPEAGAQAQRTAQVVNALKGKPVVWPVKVGGSLLAPTITDSGLDTLAKNALSVDTLKAVAIDQATEQANKQLQKQAEKDPRVKQGLDSLNKLLGK